MAKNHDIWMSSKIEYSFFISMQQNCNKRDCISTQKLFFPKKDDSYDMESLKNRHLCPLIFSLKYCLNLMCKESHSWIGLVETPKKFKWNAKILPFFGFWLGSNWMRISITSHNHWPPQSQIFLYLQVFRRFALEGSGNQCSVHKCVYN